MDILGAYGQREWRKVCVCSFGNSERTPDTCHRFRARVIPSRLNVGTANVVGLGTLTKTGFIIHDGGHNISFTRNISWF